MLVRLRIWFEIASNVWGVRTNAVEPLVTFVRGLSVSLVDIECRASMVADWGGVFSPSILCGGLRRDGRKVGVSLPAVAEVGVGVTERPVSFSGDFASIAKSLLVYGLVGRFFSGDLSGDLEGDAGIDPPSRKLLRTEIPYTSCLY
jgi:hypothetical protein